MAARDSIIRFVILNPFVPVCREMYLKGLNGDNSDLIRGPDSSIAKAIGNDKLFKSMVAAEVNAAFNEGKLAGDQNPEVVDWTSLDLQLSIGGLDSGYSWTLDSYNAQTGKADITVTIRDTFDFEEGKRPPWKEILTEIGRNAEMVEYNLEITTKMQIQIGGQTQE